MSPTHGLMIATVSTTSLIAGGVVAGIVVLGLTVVTVLLVTLFVHQKMHRVHAINTHDVTDPNPVFESK